MIRITKRFTWSMGHRLIDDYPDDCRFLHGHNYALEVTVQRHDLDKFGMVMDFRELKKLVQQDIIAPIDHAVMVCYRDEELVKFLSREHQKYMTFSKNTTAENIVSWIGEALSVMTSKLGVQLVRLKLWETESSFAEWTP